MASNNEMPPCAFLESEFQIDQGIAAQSGNNVRGVYFVVVVAVREIVHIDLYSDVLVNRMPDHCVEDPVARNGLNLARDRIQRHRGTGGPAGNIVCSYAEIKVVRQTMVAPRRWLLQ